jgi:hypothetical protein
MPIQRRTYFLRSHLISSVSRSIPIWKAGGYLRDASPGCAIPRRNKTVKAFAYGVSLKKNP